MRKRKIACWKKIAVCGLAVILCVTNVTAETAYAAGNKTGTKTESGSKTDTKTDAKKESVESATAATVQLSKTEGTVTVTGATGKEMKLVKKMRLLDGYHVETAKKSYAWEELDKSKLIKEDAVSEVEIRKSGKLLEILLNSGNMFFNVTEKLADDETMNICTSSMIAGIRGTCGWVKVIDKLCTRIYLLEGELECVVADPVTGQSKVTRLKGGQRADFYVYDKSQTGDRCDIVMEGFDREDVPGFVLVELADDTPRCQEIFEDSGIDLRDLTMEEALKRLKEDEDAIEGKLKEIEEEVAKQENNISQDPVWEDKTSGSSPVSQPPQIAGNTAPGSTPGGNDGGSSPSGGGGNTSNSDKKPTPAKQKPQNVDVTENPGAVEDLLEDGKDVVVKGDDTSNVYQIDSDLHIPEGSTLTIKDGLTLVVASAATVTVDGTLKVQGDMENNGKVIINSNKSMHVKGDLVNMGSIINQNKGLVDAAKGIDNYGTISCGGTSTMYSSSKDGTVRMCGESSKLTVAGGDITNKSSGAALALEEATQIANITFTTDTLLQSMTENVLTVGGKKLKVSNYGTSFDSGSNFFQFKIEVKTVTFDGGEGSSAKPVKVIVGFPVGTGMPTLSKAGYELSGWNTAADGSGKAFTKDTVVQDDITVYARWKENKKTHTVTFDANGGTLTGDKSVIVAHNGTVELPTPTAPEGYAFFGWYTAKDSKGKKVTGSEAITANVTYHARYVSGEAAQKWTITYDANGGRLASGTASSATVNNGEKATKPADPARSGYVFVEWCADKEGTRPYDFSTAVSANITIYAKWTANAYTVTFNANGGTIADNTGAAASETAAVTVNNGEKVTKPADPVRTDYVFVEWCTDQEGTKTYDFNAAVSADITLYAKWTRNQYVVTFDSQDGSAVAAQTVNGNETASEPEKPTKAGYTFDGWYTEAACETKYNFSTPVSANITLYAKWTINAYTVTFNANGGAFAAATGASASETTSVTVNYGEKVAKPATDPTKDGSVFEEWCADKDCRTTYDFNTAVTADITLYAKWTELSLKLKLSEVNRNPSLLVDALDSNEYKAVSVIYDDNATGAAKILKITANDSLTVPAGKTLNLEDGITLDNQGVVTVDGTLNVTGDVTNRNNLIVNSGQSLHVTGTITNASGAKLAALVNGLIEATSVINSGGVIIENSNCVIRETITNNNWVLDKGVLSVNAANTGDNAWSPDYVSEVTSLILEDRVETVSADSFAGCVNLTSVNLNKANNVGSGAFAGCTGLSGFSVSAANTAYSAGSDGVLYSKDGTVLVLCPAGKTGEFTVPNAVTAINEGAFADCVGLTKIELHADIATIASGAFTADQKIECEGRASEWTTRLSGTGIASDKISYTCIGNDSVIGIIWELNKKKSELVIRVGGNPPADIAMENYGSHYAPWYADRESIKTVDIQAHITSIGENAFEDCTNLTSVSIGSDVTSIGKYAFDGCSSLKSIDIPDNVETIGSDNSSGVFAGCSALESVTIGKGVTTIGSYAFSECKNLSTVTMAEGSHLSKICASSFYKCEKLQEFTIPETVSEIGERAFEGCVKLTQLSFGEHSRLTALGYNAFKGCSGLTGTLTIPGGLTTCGSNAFAGCTGLTGVIFKDGAQCIGIGMFADCTGLKGELVIPGSVTEIGSSAFARCAKLTSVSIHEDESAASGATMGTQSIGNYVFIDCSGITQVSIPKTVRSIGTAFIGCSSLEKFVLDSDNAYYCLSDGVLCSLTPDADSRIWLVACPAGKTGAFVMPNTITDIREGAFSGCSKLTELTIGKSVGTELRSGLEKSENFFDDMTSLTAIKVADGNVLYLAEDGVLYRKTKSLVGGVYVERYTLERCPISKEGPVAIKSNTIYLSGNGLEGCSKVTSLSVPASLGISAPNFLRYSSLKDCTSLKEINVEAGNEEYYSADGIVYSADRTQLLYCPPAKTSIDEKKIPRVLNTILGHSFHGSGLTELPIRKSVTVIGSGAFMDSSLKTIRYAGSKEQWEAIDGYDGLLDITINYNATIEEPPAVVVKSGDCGATSSDTVKWELYDTGKLVFSGSGNMKDYGSTAKNVNGNYFEATTAEWGNEKLTSIIIGDNITGIGKNAFRGITMEDVDITIGSSVKKIGDYAFDGCSKMSSLTLPDGVTEIGAGAFQGCKDLTAFKIPAGVTEIKDYTFKGCSKAFTELTIPAKVTSIGKQAFRDCISITQLIFAENSQLVTIGEQAFAYLSKISGDVVIPDKVTALGVEAFYYSTGVSWTVTLPVSLKTIGKNVFDAYQKEYRPNITKIYYMGNRTQWAAVTKGTGWNNCNAPITYLGPGTVKYSGECGDGLTWKLDDAPSLTISSNGSGTGVMTKYGAASEVPWYGKLETGTQVKLESGVTSIGDYAFSGCAYITGMTISDSVKTIGNYAFQGCTGLTALTLPTGVTTIGADAFGGCTGLTALTLPTGVTTIGDGAFRSCENLTGMTIPDGVTAIGAETFKGCTSLSSLTLPTGITTIGDGAFNGCRKLTKATIPAGVTTLNPSVYMGCTNLTQFEVAAGNQAFKAEDGVLLSKDGKVLIQYPANKDGYKYTIPDSVTTIGEGAFKTLQKWISITIPKSVRTIGDGAFSDYYGINIFYLGSEEEWGANVSFNLSENQILEDVHCKAGTIDLGGGNKLTWTLDESDKLTITGAGAIPDYDYSNAAPWKSLYENITSVVLGDSITAIGNYAFYECYNLAEITLPTGLTTIGECAFCCCENLKEIPLCAGLTAIGESAFCACYGLEKIMLPAGLTAIGDNAFYECSSLAEITLPTDLTAIGDYVFYGCSSLQMITIPAKVKTIGENAFYAEYDSALQQVIFAEGSELGTIDSCAFYGCSSLSEITLPASLTTIGASAFSGCSSLKTITIPASVTSIESYAFDGSGLTTVVYETGCQVETIGEYVFASCSNLQTITIPASVTSIESYAFNGSGLTTVNFAVGCQVETIGEYAFEWCSDLQTITIPASVTSIQSYAFQKSGLKEIEIPAGVTTLGRDIFRDCDSLVKVTFAAGCQLTEIAQGMFQDCDALTEITIPQGVTKLNTDAFCVSGLKTIKIPVSLTTIGYDAFWGCSLEYVYYAGSQEEWESTLGGYSALNYQTIKTFNWEIE